MSAIEVPVGTACKLTFLLVDATDLSTPELGEAGGQPQVMIDGAAWVNTTNTLVAVGNGEYYVELTTTETNQTPGKNIRGRYKSANTNEARSNEIIVIRAEDPLTTSDIPTESEIAAEILVTPAQKIVTDAAGNVGADILLIDGNSLASHPEGMFPHAGTLLVGTVITAGSSSITLDAGVPDDDSYNGCQIVITSGVGAGQARTVLDYDGPSRNALVSREWAVTPTAGSVFAVLADDIPDIILSGRAVSGGFDFIVLPSYASSITYTYLNNYIYISSGAGKGQARLITAYAGPSRTITVDPQWAIAPDSTSGFQILVGGAVAVQRWGLSAVDNLIGGKVQAVVADVATDTSMAAAFAALQGADGDTLETLSDQIDDVATDTSLTAAVAALQGADGDTLETLSDQIDLVTPPLGSGTVTIRVVDEGSNPLDGVRVTVFSSDGTVFIAYGYTGGFLPGSGEVHFSVPASAGGIAYRALLYQEGISFLPESAKAFVVKDPPVGPDFNVFEFEGHTGMDGVMATFVIVDTDTPTPNPVEDVRVRIFSSPDDTFLTELDTDEFGEASLVLEGDAGPDGKEYIIRLSPPAGYYGGPTRTISVIDPLGPSETNIFDFIVYPPSEVPVSTDEDMCRVSGCFTDPTLRPLKNVTLIFHPREGYPNKVIAGMPFSAEPTMVRNNIIASELHVTTDKNGRVEVDLPRESVFDVFVQGLGAGDHTLQSSIYIPDLAGIDIQEVLFPYLTSVTYSPSSLTLSVGDSAEIEVEIAASNSQPISGSAALNALLEFTSSDTSKATVLVTSEGKLLVTAIASGAATIQAARVIGSFAPRRPDVPNLVIAPSAPAITVT
jgi:hypothetical protein